MRKCAELAGRRRRAVQAELGRDPAEHGGELEAVRGPEDDDDAGCLGQPVDDEVAVRRQRVEAGLRQDVRPDRPGRWRARNAASARASAARRARTSASSGVVGWPPQSWAAFGPASPYVGKP